MNPLILFIIVIYGGGNSEGTPRFHVPPIPPQWELAEVMALECNFGDPKCGILVGKTVLNRKKIVEAKIGRKVSIREITETPWQFTSIHRRRIPSQKAMDFFLPLAEGLLHEGTHYALCSVIKSKQWGRIGTKEGYFATSDGHCWIKRPMPFPLP